MTRRSGFLQVMIQAQREAERKRQAQVREIEKTQKQAYKDAEKAQKEYEKARTANLKEQAKLYTESRMAQVQLQNEQLEQQIKTLERLLVNAYSLDPYIDIQTLKQMPDLPFLIQGHLHDQNHRLSHRCILCQN